MASALFVACGIVSLIALLLELPDGGWRRVLPTLALLAAGFAVAALLPTEAERAVALVATLAAAFALARWLPGRRDRAA